MKEITVRPKTELEVETVKDFLKSLDIHFEEATVKAPGGMEWFAATESLNSILNNLIAHFNVAIMNLTKADQSDDYKDYCTRMLFEVRSVNKNLEVWKSLELMNRNIDKYGVLAREFNGVA